MYEQSKMFLIMDLGVKNLGEAFQSLLTSWSSFKEDEISRFMKGLVEGISYMHDINIIHRDLKPENILVCDDSKGKILKITDFGTSKEI